MLMMTKNLCFRSGGLRQIDLTLRQLRESWLGLFEQFFRFDKWNACRVQAAAICDSRLK
jgi:hypothetical protein